MKTHSCFIPIRIAAVMALFVFLPVWSTAQQAYYYTFDGEKVILQASDEYLVIKPAESQEKGQLQTRLLERFPSAEVQRLRGVKSEGFLTVRSDQPLYSERSELNRLQEDLHLDYTEPVYLLEGNPVIPYNVFAVKLRHDEEFDRLRELNESHNVEILSRNALLPNLITLRINDTSAYSIIEIAQKYFHELDLKYSTPDFVQNIQRYGTVSDPYFARQFYMHMISAEYAWQVTTGSDDITVAVIDDGVMAHEDLPASRLVSGYDAFGITNGAPGGNEAHGMATAGIIAASHNEMGIAGMAPNVNTMPVRIFDEYAIGVSDQAIVTAFTHAVMNGAHVINNSWGYSTITDVNASLTNVITNAMQNGRGGLGTIVVFASGNSHQSFSGVTYPANISGVIAVGAVDDLDVIFNYSSRGSQLDLVAPSGQTGSILGSGPCGTNNRIQLNGTVWSLDQPSSNGWNPGNTQITSPQCYNEYVWSSHSGQPTPAQPYTSHYGGTSAAAPQIAGAAALMLTVDPGLELSDIRNILQSTADWAGHMGGSPPSNEYGHGRLNAYEAVKQAVPILHNESFTSSTTLPGVIRITGTASISSGVTLTVGSGNVAIIDGTINATNSTLAVNGRLIIEDSASISGVDIDVSSSGELIIREGVSLSFDNGQGIVAYGPVNINGTGNNRTILQASGTSWTGVHLHGSGSSLSHTDIQGAGNGVSIFNTSNISLSYLDVSNNSTAGIHLVNSSGVSINNVRSVDNSLYGIIVDGNNNYHWSDNAFRDNGEGLRMIGGALLDNITRTRLADNWNGMVIREDSWINIATSSFVNSLGRHAVSIENSTANARYNWWEQAPPDPMKFQEATGGTINYSSWRTQDPIPGVQFIPGDDYSGEIFASDESDLPEVIRNAGDLRRVVTAITEDPSEQLRQLDQQNWQIAPSAVPWLDVLRMELLQIEGNHKSAESIGLGLLENISLNQSVRQTAARRLFYSYLLGLKDYSKAAETLALLKELESPESPDVTEEILADLLEFYGGLTVAEPGQLQFTSTSDDAILTNYPNPFNPSTIIRYQLPENGPVTLQVFDLLGRQVAELVNEVQSAGLHSIHFNAEHLSSGLYIYRLQAGDQVLTQQMSLIK